MVCKPW